MLLSRVAKVQQLAVAVSLRGEAQQSDNAIMRWQQTVRKVEDLLAAGIAREDFLTTYPCDSSAALSESLSDLCGLIEKILDMPDAELEGAAVVDRGTVWELERSARSLKALFLAVQTSALKQILEAWAPENRRADVANFATSKKEARSVERALRLAANSIRESEEERVLLGEEGLQDFIARGDKYKPVLATIPETDKQTQALLAKVRRGEPLAKFTDDDFDWLRKNEFAEKVHVVLKDG